MTYKLIIKPLAELDAMEAATWYNDQRDGLGSEFLLALDAKINAIRRNPNQFFFEPNFINPKLSPKL